MIKCCLHSCVSHRDLEVVVGRVLTKDWNAATSLAKELHSWRRGRVRGSQSSHPLSPPAPTASTRASQPSHPLFFGDDIVFNFDLDRPQEEDDLDRAFPPNENGFSSDENGFNNRGVFSTAAAETKSNIGFGQDHGGKGGGVGKGDDSSSRGSKLGEKGGAAASPSPSFIASGVGKSGRSVDAVDAGWLYSRWWRPWCVGAVVTVLALMETLMAKISNFARHKRLNAVAILLYPRQ